MQEIQTSISGLADQSTEFSFISFWFLKTSIDVSSLMLLSFHFSVHFWMPWWDVQSESRKKDTSKLPMLFLPPLGIEYSEGSKRDDDRPITGFEWILTEIHTAHTALVTETLHHHLLTGTISSSVCPANPACVPGSALHEAFPTALSSLLLEFIANSY